MFWVWITAIWLLARSDFLTLVLSDWVEFELFWFYLLNFSFSFNFLWFPGCSFIWQTCGVCFGVSVWVFTFNDWMFILGCDCPFIPIFSHFFPFLSGFHSTFSHSELWPFYLIRLWADFCSSHFSGLGCFGFLDFSRLCGIYLVFAPFFSFLLNCSSFLVLAYFISSSAFFLFLW